MMQKAYEASDLNKDGILDEKEFINWQTLVMHEGCERGNYEDERKDTPKKAFDLINKFNTTREGVNMAEIMAILGKNFEFILGFMAEAGM